MNIPQDQPWAPYANTLLEHITPGTTYMTSQLGALCGLDISKKDDMFALLPALTYLSTAPDAVLDCHLVIYHNEELVYLDQDQHKAVVNSKTFPYKGKQYGPEQTYMLYAGRITL